MFLRFQHFLAHVVGMLLSFFFESRRGSPACITPKGNCATSPVDARKQSNRQRIALLGYTVQYNQVAGGCPKAIHRTVPGIPQPYGLTAPLRGPRGATPETRPPGPACWPPTPDQTVRGSKFLFLSPSEEVPHCTTWHQAKLCKDRTNLMIAWF